MTGHRLLMPSYQAIARIQRKRHCRFWFNGEGELVAVWRSPTGRTYAIGHDHIGRCIAFQTVFQDLV